MSSLEDVPFQTPPGPLGLPGLPDIQLPDCCRILQETEYDFSLERQILRGHPLRPPPSCPPFWLLPLSPEAIFGPPRPRSHSLSSADIRPRRRSVRFLPSSSEDEGGYGEDNEGSSPEGRPRSAAPGGPRPRSRGSGAKPGPGEGRRSARERRKPVGHEPQRSLPTSPAPSGRKTCKKKPLRTPPLKPPCRLQQQRPSSAGPAVRNQRKKGPRGFLDLELLSALSPEERELLEQVTEGGYPLRTAILALQKTGYRSPEKILKYLVASDRLCELGYDEAQVEEALEMFQNCESKAAEFLRLLTQFNEMGFQQSAIKEVLLVHENHREKALEELMTRTA